MIINTAGEYTLQYTATDACGNSTVVERDLVVEEPPTYRTVLYTDGTLIINESSRDEADNIAQHGAATNVYIPFDPNGDTNQKKYIFNSTSNRPWNSQVASITSVEIGSNISPTSTKYWFSEMTNLASIVLEKLDTSSVTNMSNMFYGCQALTSLDVSNFNTSAVTDMSSMFYGCKVLTSLDVSGFDTSVVADMSSMFRNCRGLTSLDVSGFVTNSVTAMQGMFRDCRGLTSLDVSGFVTNNVQNFTSMFNSCALLPSVNVSNFDTSSAIGMQSMFDNCDSMSTIDVSSFDTSSVTDMSYMFNGCLLLTTIYASASFVTTQVTVDQYMFGNLSNILVGGAGTVWSPSYTGKARAKIDGGTSDPGYFTARP